MGDDFAWGRHVGGGRHGVFRASKGHSPYSQHHRGHISGAKSPRPGSPEGFHGRLSPPVRVAEAAVPTVKIELKNPSRRPPITTTKQDAPQVMQGQPDWSPYVLGANRQGISSPGPAAVGMSFQSSPNRSPDAASTTAAALTKISGATYSLPPIFRDPTLSASLDAEDLAADTSFLHGAEVDSAWAAVDTDGGGQVERKIAMAALSEMWPELPRNVFNAALKHCCDDHPEGRTNVGERHSTMARASFEWLARFLGQFMKYWFLCDCLDPKDDVPLTFAEFECACHNLELSVGDEGATAQAFLAIPERGGVLGFCTWLAIRGLHPSDDEVQDEHDEHGGPEQDGEVEPGLDDENARQLFQSPGSTGQQQNGSPGLGSYSAKHIQQANAVAAAAGTRSGGGLLTRHRPRWNEPHKLAETTEPTTGAKLEEKGEEGNSSIPAVGVLSAAARRVALEAEVERLKKELESWEAREDESAARTEHTMQQLQDAAGVCVRV